MLGIKVGEKDAEKKVLIRSRDSVESSGRPHDLCLCDLTVLNVLVHN